MCLDGVKLPKQQLTGLPKSSWATVDIVFCRATAPMLTCWWHFPLGTAGGGGGARPCAQPVPAHASRLSTSAGQLCRTKHHAARCSSERHSSTCRRCLCRQSSSAANARWQDIPLLAGTGEWRGVRMRSVEDGNDIRCG